MVGSASPENEGRESLLDVGTGGRSGSWQGRLSVQCYRFRDGGKR